MLGPSVNIGIDSVMEVLAGFVEVACRLVTDSPVAKTGGQEHALSFQQGPLLLLEALALQVVVGYLMWTATLDHKPRLDSMMEGKYKSLRIQAAAIVPLQKLGKDRQSGARDPTLTHNEHVHKSGWQQNPAHLYLQTK